MTLSASTLSSALQALTPTESESEAIDRLADAWITYATGMTVLGVACGSLSSTKSAMTGAMAGLSTATGSAITAGLTAWWGSVVSQAATLWLVPPGVVTLLAPPPGIAAVSAALLAVWPGLVAVNASLADACDAMAAILHANAGLGALATITYPPPAPPTVAPVL